MKEIIFARRLKEFGSFWTAVFTVTKSKGVKTAKKTVLTVFLRTVYPPDLYKIGARQIVNLRGL